jgi:hypothetical protein
LETCATKAGNRYLEKSSWLVTILTDSSAKTIQSLTKYFGKNWKNFEPEENLQPVWVLETCSYLLSCFRGVLSPKENPAISPSKLHCAKTIIHGGITHEASPLGGRPDSVHQSASSSAGL